MKLGIGLARVSTGSQDEISQVRDLAAGAATRDIVLVKIIRLHGYSASHGMQEPALQEIIAGMERGDWSTLLVTDSSRIDRREDLDAQAGVLLSIRSAGGEVISLTEAEYGKTDFTGRLVTLVAQHANAEKSKTVKKSTYRGMMMIRDNKAHHGALPTFWATKGVRYAKQAYCADPAAIMDIFERVASGESLAAVGRDHDLYPQSIRKAIRFTANHTGVIECSYTHEGKKETWVHEVTPVVDSELWWRANKALDANKSPDRANKGGRPVAAPANWISGILDCPACGGRLFLNAGLTAAKRWGTGKPLVQRPRTPKLFCHGHGKRSVACGQFKGTVGQPVIELISGMFENDPTDILAFQRVAGNAHELDELDARLRKIQARLSATEDDDALDALIAERKTVKGQKEEFVVVPDSFDYAPTGQTVAQMWNDGDETVKRAMALAVKNSLGMSLVNRDGQWIIAIGTDGPKDVKAANGIVDLGNGYCFRR